MSGKRPRPDEDHTPLKKQKIDESSSPAETETTVPGPSTPGAKMAQIQLLTPLPSKTTTLAYPDVPNSWPVVAMRLGPCHSSRNPESGSRIRRGPRSRYKGVFVVTHHPLREKLANGLRDRIQEILDGKRGEKGQLKVKGRGRTREGILEKSRQRKKSQL
jgi:hypothetical protein